MFIKGKRLGKHTSNRTHTNIHRIEGSAKIPLDIVSDKVYYVNYEIEIQFADCGSPVDKGRLPPHGLFPLIIVLCVEL